MRLAIPAPAAASAASRTLGLLVVPKVPGGLLLRDWRLLAVLKKKGWLAHAGLEHELAGFAARVHGSEGAEAVRLKTCSVSRANEEDFAPDTVLPVAWPCAAALSVRSCARTSESVVVGAEDVLNKSPSSMLAGLAGASLCERQTQFPLGSKRPLPLLHSPQSRTYLENQGCQCPAVIKPTLLSHPTDSQRTMCTSSP